MERAGKITAKFEVCSEIESLAAVQISEILRGFAWETEGKACPPAI